MFFETDEEETSATQSEINDSVMFDSDYEENEDWEKDNSTEANTEEDKASSKEEETVEEKIEEVTEDKNEEASDKETNEEDEDIDLDSIFEDLDNANEQLDKISENTKWESNVEIEILRDSLDKITKELKRVNGEKLELQFRNSELEAFWIDSLDPKLLSLSRVMWKAKDWDDLSKDKATKLLKDMLFDLTWEDLDTQKINTELDLLTQAELYNNATNPNLSSSKEEDFGIAL